MYFLQKADILYEMYLKATKIELALDGNPLPKAWNSLNARTPAKDWKEDFCREILMRYPEFKEYNLEMQGKVLELEKEISKLKRDNLELQEMKVKNGN